MIYLDYNATTPVDDRVVARMLPYFAERFGNASSRDHAYGWDAEEAVEEARGEVAALIGANPREIVFTSGATEGITAALLGTVRASERRCVVTASTEHEAVLETCRGWSESPPRQLAVMPVDSRGRLGPDSLPPSTGADGLAMASIMMANNEVGTIHPIRELAEAAHRLGGVFFSDLAQAAGKISIDVRELGIDLAAFSAHKLYGPKGVGALYIRDGHPPLDWRPTASGGGQERGRRGGTLNVAGIVGFGEACRIARAEMPEEAARVAGLRDRLEAGLLSRVDDVWINGDRERRLGNTSNIGFRGVDARTLIRDMYDVAVSTRSACSSSKPGPSHVLTAMGLSDQDAYSSVRISLGRFTTEQEIDDACEKIVRSVHTLRRLHSVHA